jgi:hypothetical protein
MFDNLSLKINSNARKQTAINSVGQNKAKKRNLTIQWRVDGGSQSLIACNSDFNNFSSA